MANGSLAGLAAEIAQWSQSQLSLMGAAYSGSTRTWALPLFQGDLRRRKPSSFPTHNEARAYAEQVKAELGDRAEIVDLTHLGTAQTALTRRDYTRRHPQNTRQMFRLCRRQRPAGLALAAFPCGEPCPHSRYGRNGPFGTAGRRRQALGDELGGKRAKRQRAVRVEPSDDRRQ